MSKVAIKTRLKSKKTKKSILEYMDMARYIGYFVLMILLAFAKLSGGRSPFHLGLFVALAYCRENIYILSVEYVLAMIIADMSIYSLIVSAVPCVVFIVAKLLHKVLTKPMKLLHANIYAGICQLPVILLNIGSLSMILTSIAMVIVSQIFTYCAIIIVYAIVVRGVRYRLAKDEIFSLCVVVSAVFAGMYNIRLDGFTPFYFCLPLILLMCLYAGKPNVAFLTCLSAGLGAGLITGNVMIIGGLMLCTALSATFMSMNICFSAITYLLADLLVGVYFKTYGQYGYQHLVMTAVSLTIFLILPMEWKNYVVQSLGGGKCDAPERAMINRNRREVSGKLKNMSSVFNEISTVISGGDLLSTTYDSKSLAEYICADYCGNCPNVEFCSSMLGGNIAENIQIIVEKCAEKGSVNRGDLPAFLASRCYRTEGMLDIVLEYTKKMIKTAENRLQIGAGRIILGEQLRSVSGLLSELSDDVLKSVFFDSESEKKILEELSYRGVVARDIIVNGENGGYGVTITVRKRDVSKSVINEVVNEVLKGKFDIVEHSESDTVGYDNLRLLLAPKYGVVYGVSTQTMKGSVASGDTYSVERVGYDKIMLTLCDGMGSGKRANSDSTSTISMVENFYRAGFNNNAILSLINKVLATYNGERFTCLDMSVIDLTKGSLDIIKLGGVQSLLVRQGIITTIESEALPLGIVEEAEPYTERRMLLDGDMIVMFTDGIADALGIDCISAIVSGTRVINPQALSDIILQKATFGGAKDDSTVIVARIYTKKD